MSEEKFVEPPKSTIDTSAADKAKVAGDLSKNLQRREDLSALKNRSLTALIQITH